MLQYIKMRAKFINDVRTKFTTDGVDPIPAKTMHELQTLNGLLGFHNARRDCMKKKKPHTPPPKETPAAFIGSLSLEPADIRAASNPSVRNFHGDSGARGRRMALRSARLEHIHGRRVGDRLRSLRVW